MLHGAGRGPTTGADKPLHPHGPTAAASSFGTTSRSSTGVQWLDQPGTDEVLVRTSRAIGLPAPLPDFHGLAIRVGDGSGGHADLLFATTAWNQVGRHLLLPTLGVGPTLSTLLPYRGTENVGPVVLGARHVGISYQLYWAPVGRPWRDLGELRLEPDVYPDAKVSFDPTQPTTPPG